MEGVHTREKGKLKEPKTCRIFFSSPFGGMEEEREELTRKYFPQIQHACNAKGVQFVAVDMRWGITSQAAENAQVINICLREVDRSDLFVGFFGQRYGWHGADDRQLQDNFDNAVSRYPWLETVRDRSVTELEFLHGHLNNPGVLPACMCFRNKAYDDVLREEGLSKGDKKQVFKYSSESDHATTLMDDLKDRVKATENKCLGVDLAYPHPHKGAQFMFDSIWPYLTEVLLANTDDAKVTKREEQLMEQDAFRERYISVYDGGQQYLEFLNNKLEEGQGTVLTTGPAGSGKSALLCNWTVQLEKSHPEVVLIYHFVGCAPSTTDARDILSRLLSEVKHVLGRGDDDSKHDEKKADAEDVQSLQMLLLGAIEEVVKEKQRIVIVLDGLNKSLKAGKTSKHLYWLPNTWPQGVLFVTSTVDNDTPTLDLLVTEKHYETLAIKPLGETAKQEICVKVLKKSGKELSAEQLARIVAAQQTNNPLYLRLVVAELSIFGYFRLLDKKIDSLIYCHDVEELLQKIFTRLEEDYSGKEEHNTLVQEVLCAIELSHRGLLEKELMEMLEVESHVWLPLYFAMEGLLVSHAGLLRFGFVEISDAVRAKYLQDDTEKTRIQRKLIAYFDKQLQNIPVWEDLLTPLSKRPVEELPWLQLAVGDMSGLSTSLLNIFTLERMQKDFKYEFFELWKATEKKMSEVCDLYLSMFDLAVADLYLHYEKDVTVNAMPSPGVKLRPLLKSMRDLFQLAEYHEGAVKVLQRDVDVLTHVKGAMASSERFKSMLDTGYQLACAHVECRNFKEGEELHRHVMDRCQSYLADHPGDDFCVQTLGFTSHGIGVIYVKQRRYDEAITMFEESIKQHSQLDNKDALATAYSNLGMTHMQNDNPKEGLQYMQKSLKMSEELYFGHLPLEIGNLLTNIGLCYRRLNDLDQAEAIYKRSLEVKANAVGWNHDVVSFAYMNLGSLNMYKEDYVSAEQYIHKAMAVQEGNGATLDKPEYRMTTENLLGALLSQGKLEELVPFYLPLFHKLQEIDMDHCIPSIHREMAKYFLHIDDANTAREITMALINSDVRHELNYVFLDHLQLRMPEEQRPSLPSHCTLEHALTLWPGNPDLVRQIIEHHALPVGDIDTILRLQTVCAENNRDWGAHTYDACADWCTEGGNKEAAAQVLEAGLKDYPEALDMRVRLMDLYRSMQEPTRAYPHLPIIIEGRKDDPACVIVAGDLAVRSSDYQMALQCFDQVSVMDNPQLAEMAQTHAKLVRDFLADNNATEAEDTETSTLEKEETEDGTSDNEGRNG